jgi:outer membrane receptor protein involved in Fe transport
MLEVGTLDEAITVVGIAPMIDIKDSQTATTEMPKELEQIPSGRSMRSQLKFAPGVYGSSHPSVYGSSQSLSNNFMIDGVTITSPEAGEAEVSLDFDSIEEMKVAGIGAPAEYGGFTGAIVNVVTKSGGNELSALFTFFMQHQSWHSANWGNNEDLIRKDWDSEYGFHLNIGGPIIQDKLWYYVSGKYERFKLHIEDFEGPTEYGYEARSLGKLNWQIDSKNRFTGWFGYQKDPIFNIEAGPLTAPESVPVDQRWQTYWNASFLHVFSDVTFLEAKFGGYFQRMNLELQSDDPTHFDLETEELSGNFWEYWEGPRERYQLNASVSHHAEEFIAGSHDFKFGVEFERSPLANRRGFPGGRFYYDLDGEPYIMAMYDGYAAEPTTQRISAFVQDSWTIGDRLTINAGVRTNHVRGNLPDPLGAVYKPKLGIAPRLGLTFDVFGDHSTALKAHYGKYYHGIMGMFYLHFQPQGTYSEWFWEDPDWVLDFEDVWSRTCGKTNTLSILT